jgi:hypothetical protein
LSFAAAAEVAAGAGLGSSLTVVLAGLDELLVRQTARRRLYHFVQSVVLEVVFVVAFTAPGAFPVEVSVEAVRQTALFAFPGFVQS